MRLNKFLAINNLCSRRKADDLIESGEIFVNKRRAKLGLHLRDGDTVNYKDQHFAYKESIYEKQNQKTFTLALNKASGIECTCSPQVENNIIRYLRQNARFKANPNFHKIRFYPIGRLDKNSRGLILLTNNGELANQLSHPRYKHKKIYRVRCKHALSNEFVEGFQNGQIIEVKDDVFKKTKAVKIKKLSHDSFEVILKEGMNRQIRKVAAKLRNEVIDLQRIEFAGLKLADLKISEGDFKELEIEKIFKLES